MQRKGDNIRRSATGTDKLRPSHCAMTTNSESRWGVRYYDVETKMDTLPAGEYHRAARLERHAGRATGGAAQGVCSAPPHNWPATAADHAGRRRPVSPRLVHAFMYDHSPFNTSYPRMTAGHCRPRSYLSAGVLAAQRINAAVSQLREKQVGRGQDEAQEESAEPP